MVIKLISFMLSTQTDRTSRPESYPVGVYLKLPNTADLRPKKNFFPSVKLMKDHHSPLFITRATTARFR